MANLSLTKPYCVACIVCGKQRRAWGIDFDHAFTHATADGSGWTWRRSPTGEHIEMLCPEHADAGHGPDAA